MKTIIYKKGQKKLKKNKPLSFEKFEQKNQLSREYIENIKHLFLDEGYAIDAISKKLNCPEYFVTSIIEPHSVHADPLGCGKKRKNKFN